jgi:hypothetical protein
LQFFRPEIIAEAFVFTSTTSGKKESLIFPDQTSEFPPLTPPVTIGPAKDGSGTKGPNKLRTV